MLRALAPITLAASILACASGEARPPQDAITADALSLTEIACIFGSAVTDSAALATFCKIAPKLVPIVAPLVGQREGAKRAGVLWHPPAIADGGVEAGAALDAAQR